MCEPWSRTGDTPTRRGGQKAGVIAIGAFIALFNFWVVADYDIICTQSPYDDAWFLHRGEHAYWFDGGEPYSSVASFLKEPPYPLFVALTHRLGIPLYLAHLAFYFIAAAVLSACLVYRQSSAWVGLVVFAAATIHPLPAYVFRRSVHDSIYTSLLLLSAAALLWQLKRSGEPGRWRRWLVTGLVLGLFWNTRQERELALIVIGLVLMVGAVTEWRRRDTIGGCLRAWTVEWIPPLGILAVITLAFMGANYARWGVFSLTDMRAPNFRRAYQALLRIKPDQPLAYVSITRDMRLRAYEVSPSFRELEPWLEGSIWEANNPSWASTQDIPLLEYSGGWFVLCLRQAADAAGHCKSATASEEFYGRVADEITRADLPTRRLPPIGGWSVHPDPEVYLSRVWPSWRTVWFSIWAYPGDELPQADDDLRPESQRLFDRVARRCADRSMSESGARGRIRHLLWTAYLPTQEPWFATAFLVSAIVLVLPAASVRWPYYLLPAVLFGAYGAARTMVFVLFDASMFPGTDIRYLLPAVVSFTIVAAWLWADGVQRIGGDLTARLRRDWAPAESRRRFTRTALAAGLSLLSAVLFVQWRHQRTQPPDTHEMVGVVFADANNIHGWARLKENPHAPAQVDLYFDGKLAATVTADAFDKEGLLDRRIGTGHHGFSLPTPDVLKDGGQHFITAKVAGTNYQLWQSPLPVRFRALTEGEDKK